MNVVYCSSNQCATHCQRLPRLVVLLQVIQVSDERAEADTVVSRMQQLHNEGRHKWKDMAILYRTNAQSRLFEEQLVSA